MQQYYNHQILIQQLVQKIEQLISEISKLTWLSNQLIDQNRQLEIQLQKIKSDYNEIWKLVPIHLKNRNNNNHCLLNQNRNLLNEQQNYIEKSRLVIELEEHLKPLKGDGDSSLCYCLDCRQKDLQIENLKAQLKKQAQIILQIQKQDEDQVSRYRTQVDSEHPLYRARNSSMTTSSRMSQPTQYFYYQRTQQ